MGRSAGLAIFAIALLILTSAPVWGASVGGTPPRPPPHVTPEFVRPASNTSVNDDLVLNATPPSGTYAPGTVVHVSFRITVTSSNVTGGLTVYLPQLLASFPAVPAPVNVFLSPRNLTIGVGATVSAAPGGLTLRNTTTFNGTRPATVNSQLVALMASAPFGQDSVTAQWNWTITTTNGGSSTSGWGPANPPAIHPAELAVLASLTPRSLVPPAPVTACLTGPVQGRTFSLHAETPKPFDDFVGNSTRDPVGGPSTWCLTVVIPVNITPQTILMHVWDYEAVTLLLYIAKVKVGNNSTAGGGLGLPGLWSDYANGAIVVGAVGVGVVTAVIVRREPFDRPTAGPPPPPPG
jgi:hypothetical protein